jgi:hypothetical protein
MNMTRKFNDETVQYWTALASDFLAVHAPNYTRHSVTTGSFAWTIASRCGITQEAYKDRSVTDGHIQTALEDIFPNAVFKDKKAY